ncbi:YIP1 family protein [Rhodobacter sp. KR11]|uniref:YIP1 family protein n=1 Tax=Rhodobacter sp. KR11 TaxID=2974588 RepID=UPI00222165C3|nr:YIP1 family protein [Rhodobacter sp. KR11]MCW1919458.1 YIP1 family protein [Rhodobacter sp. KR11]
MALTADIAESWRRPRAVIRRLRARGRSESFVFTLLAIFLVLSVVAAAPDLSRQAALEQKPLAPYLLGASYGALVFVPVFYLMASVFHLMARLMGGTGTHYDGRLALVWALVTISPVILVLGLARAMAPGLGASLLGLTVFAAFLGFYSVMLREVESA